MPRLLISAYERTTGSPGSALLLSAPPAGPYLHSLRCLALPLATALAAHPLLAHAGQLHTLCLQLPDMEAFYELPLWPAFWQFVATHPLLRRLLYEVASGASDCPFRLLDAVLALKERRTALQAQRLVSRSSRMYCLPTCWGEISAGGRYIDAPLALSLTFAPYLCESSPRCILAAPMSSLSCPW